MKKIALLLKFVLILLFCKFSSAQPFVNDGASINAINGVIIVVDGNVHNEGGLLLVEENSGLISEIIIQNHFFNNATAGGSGYYRVLGNWVNNNTFNASTGSVFMEGGNQLLTGTASTYFHNLILDGTGIKTQEIDQYVLGTLNLNHLELSTQTHSMFVENNNTNAILRDIGFVSSLNEGFLSRNTNTSQMYLFPVGSSLDVNRYRPVEITPDNTNANSYTVRLANVDATTEGFNRSQHEPEICETNPFFYHRINRSSGTTPINLKIFYNEADDGEWEGIANWTVSPDEWQIVQGSTTVFGTPFSYANVNSWNTFNQTPYILYNAEIAPVFDELGPYCMGDTPGNLPTTSVNGIEGTWNPATIDTSTEGEFTYTFTPNDTDACYSTTTLTIIIDDEVEPTFTQLGPYCVGDTPADLPTTSINGVEGTWNPATINTSVAGDFSYTFTPDDADACYISTTMTITIHDEAEPTFETIGPYCVGDTPDALPSTSIEGIEGTWSPATVNTSNAGEFQFIFTPDDGNCFTIARIDIIIEELVEPTFDQLGPYCEGDIPDILPATSNNSVEGTWNPATINSSVAGVFTYTFTPSDTEACYSVTTMDITIEESVMPEFTQLGPYCIDDTPDSFPLTSINGIEGTWSPATINTSEIGVFTFTFTPDNENECYSIATMNISVEDDPDATITPVGPYCYGDFTVTLTAVTGNGIWSGNGITDSNTGVFDLTVAGAGTHQIIYFISAACGDATDTIEITIYPNITGVNDVPENPVCIGGNDGTIMLTVTGGTSPYIFEWNDGGYSDTELITGLSVGDYSITITDDNGCYYVTSVTLNDGTEVCIEIPNAFTPNGDGINDDWLIENIESYPDFYLQVFNRWGQVVFNARHGDKPWNGTYNNKPLPTGPYLYVLKLDNSDEKIDPLVGIVTLVR